MVPGRAGRGREQRPRLEPGLPRPSPASGGRRSSPSLAASERKDRGTSLALQRSCKSPARDITRLRKQSPLHTIPTGTEQNTSGRTDAPPQGARSCLPSVRLGVRGGLASRVRGERLSASASGCRSPSGEGVHNPMRRPPRFCFCIVHSCLPVHLFDYFVLTRCRTPPLR